MSRDKSDYVRFELRFEKEFSDRVNAWIKANADGSPKSEIVRKSLEHYMDEQDIILSQENQEIIDQIRARYPIPSRRNDIVGEALKKYIEFLDKT